MGHPSLRRRNSKCSARNTTFPSFRAFPQDSEDSDLEGVDASTLDPHEQSCAQTCGQRDLEFRPLTAALKAEGVSVSLSLSHSVPLV